MVILLENYHQNCSQKAVTFPIFRALVINNDTHF